MSARIGKPISSSARVAGLACIFLSGVGVATVMNHLPDMFGNVAASSCSVCRTSVCNSVVTTMEPLLTTVAGSAAPVPVSVRF